MNELILASSSPRRRELLNLITPAFRVYASDIQEIIPPGTPPAAAVEQLALQKAQAVLQSYPGNIVIGADTIVVLEGEILGKPRDKEHARQMLRALSGRLHSIYTGVALCGEGVEESFHSLCTVQMEEMGEAEIRHYVDTGEPMDKAGAYAIQGQAALFVREISGEYAGAVGLPVAMLYRRLKQYFPQLCAAVEA